MTYEDLFILISSHSLEDFPTELGEAEAAGLLNAFAVPWHPALLASARVIPSWHRADDPPQLLENRLVIIPPNCDEWIQSGWADNARSSGAVVLEGLSDRDEMLQAALQPLETQPELNADLVKDFLALGTNYLMLELLTRHMHHFSNLDEVYLQREALAAADAALADDETAAKTHLRACFEVLTEARERFYPIDCYLIDLCLMMPDLDDEHLDKTVSETENINYLISGKDLEKLAQQKPNIVEQLKSKWENDEIEIIGGEYEEGPLPLLPIESILWQFQKGREVYQSLCGRSPNTWGRRRFGLSTIVPQILSRLGFQSALHLVLDDGLYPDQEQSKLRWEGSDGSVVDAISRIPLAADSASSFLRFPVRMAESMEEDHVAALIFARWPEVKSPWLDDLRRMNAYSASLGKFVTFDYFFQNTDDSGRLSSHEAKEYFSPFLIQSVARQEENPLNRYPSFYTNRHRFDAACWCRTVAEALQLSPINDSSRQETESILEISGHDAKPEERQSAQKALEEFVPQSIAKLSNLIMGAAGQTPGFLILNTLSFSRRVSVEIPNLTSPPSIAGPVKAVQFGEQQKSITVELPGSGFVWIPAESEQTTETAHEKSLTAEENVLRNEFFEVYINVKTGGIARIKEYGRKPNRLSQQLAYRFSRERTVFKQGDEDAVPEKTFYSEMRCQSIEITCDGPALGEIITTGDIVDQANDMRLAGFKQTVRVWRGRPSVEIEIELDVENPPDGDPWTNYFASRFAFNDSTASLTRSVNQGAHSFLGERFESPYYLEIATPEERTTILNHGNSFHRKTGQRMIDSLLVAAGDTQSTFRFTIAIDEKYPMTAAMDSLTPPLVIPTTVGPPKSGNSGWFFHLNSKNVQISRILGLTDEPDREQHPWEDHDHAEPLPGKGFTVRLLETEGRYSSVKLQCFRTPTTARQKDFQGRTITDLRIEDGAVMVEMSAFEICDVELRFAD